MNEFDLRSFLYSNPLLESEKKLKAKKKELEKKEDKLDSIDMKDEDAKEKAKHHKGAIKNVKKEIKDLEKDLKFDEKAAKKEGKEAKEEAKAKKKKKSIKENIGGKIENEFQNWLDMVFTQKDYPEIETLETVIDYAQSTLRDYAMDSTTGDFLSEGKDKKLTKEGLKDMIRERITSILNEDAELYEAEEENIDVDVKKDVDIDVKDEVDVDDESVESDVEVKTSVPGADKDTSEVLGLLTKASEASDAFTDDPELKTQIGNTITYFTRKHVAKV